MPPEQPRRIPHEIKLQTKLHYLIVAGLSATFFSVFGVGAVMCVLMLPTMSLSGVLPYFGLLAIAALFMGTALPYALAKEELMSRKAQALAKKHLGGRDTEWNIIETCLEPTITSAELVINDWGLVYVEPGKRAVELSWNDIDRVEEPLPMRLEVHPRKGKPFTIVPSRYYLIAGAMYVKLPDRTRFDVNPITGKSNLAAKLKDEPRKWGKYLIDATGIHWGKKSAPWKEIRSVREIVTETEEGTFSQIEVDSWEQTFTIGENETQGDAYLVLKAVIEDTLPGKCEFRFKAPSAWGRALQEFDRMADITTAAMKIARKTHKYAHLERYFAHMQTLQEMFSFSGEAVDKFYTDYADALQYMGRTDEANQLLKRIN